MYKNEKRKAMRKKINRKLGRRGKIRGGRRIEA